MRRQGSLRTDEKPAGERRTQDNSRKAAVHCKTAYLCLSVRYLDGRTKQLECSLWCRCWLRAKLLANGNVRYFVSKMDADGGVLGSLLFQEVCYKAVVAGVWLPLFLDG
jgi:hypothetical protein